MKKCCLALFLAFALSFSSLAMAAEQLTIFMWSEYMDPDVIKSFEKEFDCKVRLDYYESNEEMVAKLQSGALGQYDIIMPSTYMMPSLLNLKLIQPLDHTKLPNIKNLKVEFTKVAIDPGNKYSLPYMWGTSGLAVRYENLDPAKNSWGLLFDPEMAIGGVILFDTARDAIGSALKYLGYSLNSTDPKEIGEAVKLLSQVKTSKNFQGFDNGIGGLNKVMSQIATVAQSYSGDSSRAAEEDPALQYIIPKEGAEIWLDLVAIPEKAPNLELAHKFLNYLMEAKVAAQLATFNRAASPNEAAKAYIPKEDINNANLYPPQALMDKLEYMQDLGANTRLYDEAWTMIKNQ